MMIRSVSRTFVNDEIYQIWSACLVTDPDEIHKKWSRRFINETLLNRSILWFISNKPENSEIDWWWKISRLFKKIIVQNEYFEWMSMSLDHAQIELEWESSGTKAESHGRYQTDHHHSSRKTVIHPLIEWGIPHSWTWREDFRFDTPELNFIHCFKRNFSSGSFSIRW